MSESGIADPTLPPPGWDKQPESDWKPLYLFNIYRLLVAAVFLSTFLTEVAPSFLGKFDERLFMMTAWLYAGFALLSEFTIKKSWPSFNIQVLSQVLMDIFMITLLMHASGGVNSGLGMLLIVAIAGGSLLTEGRTAFFFAAVASLCVLVEVTIADIYGLFYSTNYTHGGLLGVTFFATAFLAFSLAQRVRASETLAHQRGEHLRYLAHLNAQIVQHIESGIVVVDILGRIRLFNEAARRLLGLKEQPQGRALLSVAPELAEQLTTWQQLGNSTTTPSLFRPALGEVEVMATFTELKRGGAISVLIVLQDATLMARQAEQLKLASLGRLTASIAHEIRNPLSAISHAGQLLAESATLGEYQTRLTQIIVNHSQRVNTIIENVSQLSRRSPANLEFFDLYQWLQIFVEEFIIQQGLTPGDILIRPPTSPVIVGFDPGQFYQVVNNLCDNGLRYSQGSPLLELSMDTSERPYLEVRDHGHGMSEQVKAQIFEPFFTTERMGSGLGLYIAREICAANQASLHLFSNTHTGCCFRVHFSSGQ